MPKSPKREAASIARRLLREIGQGNLSLPYLLEAWAETADGRALAENELEKLQAQRRSPRRRASANNATVRKALSVARRTIGARRGVRGVHYGVRRVGGELSSGVAVVFAVDRKIELTELGRRAPIPRHIDVDGTRFRTDVVEVAKGVKCADILGSSGSAVRARLVGQLSAAVVSPKSARVFLSGHVAGGTTRDVVVTTPLGHKYNLGPATCHRDDSWIDSASVDGVSPELAREIGSIPRAIQRPEPSLERLPVTVSVRRSPGIAPALITDVFLTVIFSSGPMYQLIQLHPAVTEPGDSGGPVRDLAGRLIGFVVGANSKHTFVIPAQRALYRVHAGCHCPNRPPSNA